MMKQLGYYYGAIILIVLLSQLTPMGQRLFPRPKINTLQFPSQDQTFSPVFPVLNPGLQPQFPASEIILQERLFAPFIVLKEQNLKNKNLSKAHLSFADLREADLRGTDLSQALLYGAHLEGALFNRETKLPFTKDVALTFGMREEP
ncbi:pentapeptide repeat-containing protein [Bdellovibrio bacteriovorus]|uniref:pentapeptide repeat-containing protein n=1 Tax=Bdellovibrio TaxID=958 RepID=UPI0035A823B5